MNLYKGCKKKRGSRPFDVGNSWIELQESLIDDGVTLVPHGMSRKEFLEQMSTARSNLTGQQSRERTTGEGLEFLLTDTRLEDGGIVTIVTDVTELKRQNEAMQRLSSAMQKVPNGMMLWDKDDRLVLSLIHI